MPCPFYNMDMCGAVADPKLAKLYTSRQRCMYEYGSCSIYLANRDRVRRIEDRAGFSAANPNLDGKNLNIVVECEFYSEGVCRVLRRQLTIFEAKRCASHYQTCPIRERALRNRLSFG